MDPKQIEDQIRKATELREKIKAEIDECADDLPACQSEGEVKARLDLFARRMQSWMR